MVFKITSQEFVEAFEIGTSIAEVFVEAEWGGSFFVGSQVFLTFLISG